MASYTNIQPATKVSSGIVAMRRRLLQVHSAILFLVATVTAVYATIGRVAGVGVLGFLQQNPLVWTGLIQAYLLMAIIAGLLWLGARDAKARRWDVVGALAHLPPVIAVIFSWHVLNTSGFSTVAVGSLTFHTFWIVVETVAALYSDPVN